MTNLLLILYIFSSHVIYLKLIIKLINFTFKLFLGGGGYNYDILYFIVAPQIVGGGEGGGHGCQVISSECITKLMIEM